MHRVISSRPKTFPDLVTAVRWAKAANVVRNIESAKISIPSQLVEKQIEDRVSYIWRTDLLTTEPYWKGTVHLINAVIRMSYLPIPCL